MFPRITIQDKVRRMEKEPREDARKEVEQLRALLSAQFNVLEAMQHRVTTDMFAMDQAATKEVPSMFDDLDGEGDDSSDSTCHDSAQIHGGTDTAGTSAPTTNAVMDNAICPPEHRYLSIPSTWINQDNPFCVVELKLRIQQAAKTLQSLRDTIADKSFQYSDIIRVAPNKGVRTRARATIAKFNNTIGYLSRVYAHCRMALVRLQAGDHILNKYQILLKEHVKSSTVLLNPNEPGSTRIQLSWIWQIGGQGQTVRSQSMNECGYILLSIYIHT